ncbi:hypothetical protein GUJ93_ZPchr0007g3542 [Zizania palustris]|uniref:PAP/OAS1 substrate-binding-related domain-containing protein n=1 Tax=Zizania palustris TaxID=103762 RepID=A0A8J5TF94_ZIZPA|nr:hypothetical protein GUJ93_ZPchr0007g3542 [Zizania palustris]
MIIFLSWQREPVGGEPMAYFGSGGSGGSGGGGGRWRSRSAWGGSSRAGRRSLLPAMMATRIPRSAAIPVEAMRAAEEAAREVVLRLQPTEEAERTRQDIVGYLKRLFGSSLGCEVFVFGSVPLKTYLPDGDIDVTILGNTAPDSTFISDACENIFRCFCIQVKLIKCAIKNIVVDISFNQIGGVSTLCFLELVDREVGKNHLFKRSIILIKAWCYHESHILGAHRGLISTYALETLVLYIFNIFHKSLHGPLEVLYKFLEYFSNFDWSKHCLSLNGPVPFSSLPNLTVEPSGMHDELLFGKEIFDRLILLSEVSDGPNTNFRLKHLNIIDPLKRNNNLGRSVNKASFYRIQSAFSFGAQRLGQILMLPSDLIPAEIFGFFANTLKRHGRGERPDLGNNGLFESLFGPEYALEEDSSYLKSSDTSEDENRSPDHSLELADNESDLEKNTPMTSGRYFRGDDALDRSWNKIWFANIDSQCYKIGSGDSFRGHSSFPPENGNVNSKRSRKDCTAEEDLPVATSFVEQQIFACSQSHILTPSARTNTLDVSNSCPTNESNWSDLHEEKLPLSPFSPSNLSELSGDLDLHLGCLRKVQYHLESLFDGLVQLVQEASLSGVLDEHSFKIPTGRFLPNTNARFPRHFPVSSAGTERKNSGDTYRNSLTEHQVNAFCQQNVALPFGTHMYNGLALPPSPAADSENYPVSWFHTTEDSFRMHGTGMHTLNNVPLFSATDILSYAMPQFPFLVVDPEDGDVFTPFITGAINVSRGTGTFIPRMSYEDYKQRLLSEKGRTQRGMVQGQVFRIKNNSPEPVCSTASNGGIAVECTNHIPTKQNSRPQVYSSKSTVPLPAGGGSAKDKAPTNSVTIQTPPSLPRNVHDSQHGYVCSDMNMIDNQKNGIDEGLVGPDTGSSELPTTEICHPIERKQDDTTLEFGSLGPISDPACTKFRGAFPHLPSSKGPAEAPTSSPVSPRPAATGRRPQGFYELKNEADFPALRTGPSNKRS